MLSVEGLDRLIAALWSDGYEVVGPTVRDGAIVQGAVHGDGDLPIGWTDQQEAGRYRLLQRDDDARFGFAVGPQSGRTHLQPPRETLVTIRTVDGHLEVDRADPLPRRRAFLGLRACDLAAIAVQDRVLAGGPHPDARYVERRRSVFVVAVTCADPAATCFCASMGTGPEITEGFDVRLTELLDEDGHRFLAEAGSPAGEQLIALLASGPSARPVAAVDTDAARAVVRASTERMGRHLDADAARWLLRDRPEHPRWDDVAGRCLSCTNCTLVCPTCFCSSMEDRSDLRGDRAERVRRWESCFSLDHSYLHGAGPVRADIRSRYRQWLTHKLSTWWDQFEMSGCVGCGRCITWCPAGIDLTEEVAAIAEATPASRPTTTPERPRS